MKKYVSLVMVILLVISCLTACGKSKGKDADKGADYLYDWLTEHGTLVDGGTCLQYSEIAANGAEIALYHSTPDEWYVTYKVLDDSGYTVVTRLTLFGNASKAHANITVSGFGDFDAYWRCMEYFHNPKRFTRNSPIEQGAFSGSEVRVDVSVNAQGNYTIVDELASEMLMMNSKCEELAHERLCFILDWLKDSFCPTANMTMSDFGYNNY